MNSKVIEIYNAYDAGVINIYEMINKLLALGYTDGEIMKMIGEIS